MRILLLPVLAGLVAGGCAARLPLPATPAPGARTVERASFMTPVSEEHLARAVVPASEREARVSEGYEGYEGPEEEEELRHEIAIFLGYSFERGEGGFTVGLDYGYALSEAVGIGPFVDYVAGDLDALAVGAGLFLRPFPRFRDLSFFLGPGVDITHAREEAEGGEAEEGGHGGEAGKKWEVNFLLRMGVQYGFDLGRGYRLVPSFYYDRIGADSKAYVVGLTFGKEF